MDRVNVSCVAVLAGALLSFAPYIRGEQEPPGLGTAVSVLKPGKAVDRSLAGDEAHGYTISLKAGESLRVVVDQRGVDVVVSLFGPDGKSLAQVDSPNGDNGPEPVELVAPATGNYRLEVRTLEKTARRGQYQVKIEEVLTPVQRAERLAAEKARYETIKSWFAKTAIQLKTAEAGNGFDDMQPLKKLIGGAHLVALGEATHGTREFFQLKHRMLEFLASEMGFTVFGIEATMPEGFDINEYVLNGTGDPAAALAGLYFWTWDTEEVLDMIRWMRHYNADPRHERKLKFYGVDAQYYARAAKVAAAFLSRVDAQLSDETKVELASLANPFFESLYESRSTEKKQAAANTAQVVLDLLDRQKADFVAKTSAGEWAVARQHAQVLAQTISVKNARDMGGYGNVRDRAMADNVRWILEHEGPGTKMVLWAHNGHVSTGANPPYEPMGYHLRKMFGADMVVFGFAFNQGSFQAMQIPLGTGGLRRFTVKPAPEGSLDATLAVSGLKLAAIDLHAIPKEGWVATWFDQPHVTRNLGAVYIEQNEAYGFGPLKVTEPYDALLFVETTTSARANPAGTRSGSRTLAAPTNLDFENSEAGTTPMGWTGPVGISGLTYEAVTSDERPHAGNRCAEIRQKPGLRYGETFGKLGQTIDAKPLRGKRATFRAAVRTEGAGSGSQAYLWLRIQKQGIGPASSLIATDLSDRPITTADWRVFETIVSVPNDASTIDYGLALVGDGRAWLDSVSLEMAGESKR
jgi:erythromycin esterase